MNDPGLDSGIESAAKALHSDNKADDKSAEKASYEQLLAPSRWYVSATEIPLLASTFGPVANAFSICALAQSWRVEYDPGQGQYEGSGVPVQDPPWLLGVNALQLLCGLVANGALLLTITERVRFGVALPLTVGGFYVSAFLLVGLLAAADQYLQLPGPLEHAWAQAYYYGILAAVLYFGMASLLLLTLWGAARGAHGHGHGRGVGFRLSAAQRTLMAQTMVYMLYLLAGAAVFARIEGWEFLNSVYWASFTLLTIGLGTDFHPSTHGGRTLLLFYAAGGILILGLVIGSIRSLMLDRAEVKIESRLTEKQREKLVAGLDGAEGRKIVRPIHDKGAPGQDGPQSNHEYLRRQQEFEIMRRVQARAAQVKKWTSLAFSVLAFSLLWFLGAMVFWFGERNIQAWSYFDALYFSYTTLLTIGYGDLYPISNASKPFFVLWTLLAIPTLTVLISNLGDTLIRAFRDAVHAIGAWTVPPGDSSLRARLRFGAKKLRDGHLFADEETPHETEADPVAALSGAFRPDPPTRSGGGGGGAHPWHRQALDRAEKIAGSTADDEAQKQNSENEQHGPSPQRLTRHRTFLLAVSIRKVLGHVADVPPKQYTFAEWAFFMGLLGVDERDPRQHREVRLDMSDGLEHDGGATREKEEFSWMGIDSPLLHCGTGSSESEWLLDRLTAAQEEGIIDMIAKTKTKRCEEGLRRRGNGLHGEGGDQDGISSSNDELNLAKSQSDSIGNGS